MPGLLTLLGIILACLSLNAHAADTGNTVNSSAAQVIRYPRLSTTTDPHSEYVLDILRQAISYSGQPYQLQGSRSTMQQARSIYELTSSQGTVDVLWTMSTDEREARGKLRT